MSQINYGSGDPQLEIHSISDGKLYKYGIVTRFSVMDKKRIINCLINLVSERAAPEVREYGVQGLRIINDSTGGMPNYQSPDGILADDVICEICDILSGIQDDDIIDTVVNHIAEQCKDMITTNGYCPTGRCSRMYNVYFFLRDYVDGVCKPRSV